MLSTGALTTEGGTGGADGVKVDDMSGLPAPTGVPSRAERWTSRTGLALIGVQFAFLVGLSAFTFRRFTLGVDFAIFSQAWSQIGAGHLDPLSTIHGVPFLRNHFELIMWPLALLHPVVHTSFVLPVVQDLALVGTEVVAFVWVTALVRRSPLGPAWRVAVSAGTVALLLAAPGVYTTVVEDFHFEAVATFFAVFAAYDLWSGRTRRMWVWVVLCLLCGDVGGLYVLGVGLSGLVVRGRRRPGLALLLVGLGWVAVISVLGYNQGSNLSSGYGYLAGRTVLPGGLSGLWLLIRGSVAHPGRPFHVATPRLGAAARYVLSGGGVGVLTPWGFAVPLVVLGTSVLQHDGIFIGLPFQNVVVIPFVTFGTAWLVVWMATRARTTAATSLAVAVGVVALVAGGLTSAQRMPTALEFNASGGFVPGPDAAALAQVLARTPPDAEVIAPLPTVGRFGERPFVYLLIDRLPATAPPLPVRARTVVVVVEPAVAPALLPGPLAAALVSRLEQQGARVIVSTPGVTALVWHPPAGVVALRLP